MVTLNSPRSSVLKEHPPYIPGFQLRELLGVGGSGAVYAASDEQRGQEVAIKVVQGLAGTQRARFEREAALHTQLRHPDIVRAHRWGLLSDLGWIAFDRLHGQDLSQLIRHPDLSFMDRMIILIRIARALQHGHEQGVIHRDVKPHNIFVREDEGPCLLDFGVAKLPDKPLTMTGRLVGTPGYMAPEYILETPVDHRVDVFGLGVVAFNLLTGRAPWSADETHTLLIRICSIPPVPFLDVVADAPVPIPEALKTGLAGVVHRAIAHDPEDRYPDAGTLARVLDQAREGKFDEALAPPRPRSGNHDRLQWARARAEKIRLEMGTRRRDPQAELETLDSKEMDIEARSSRVFWLFLLFAGGALLMALAVAMLVDFAP